MQYDLRWINHGDREMLVDLAREIYSRPRSSYPYILDPSAKKDNPLYYFLVPDTISNHQSRRVLGVFDGKGKMVMAIATRSIEYSPVWMISWTISTLKSAAFCSAWRQAMDHLTAHFEREGVNEFYVVSPVDKEAVYSRLMKHLRERYWTFVEATIKEHQKSNYGLHWLIMGQHLYQYDLNIRRYILRRAP